MLSYPDPPLDDGVVRLRPWTDDDLGCIEEASGTDIPSGTTVPAVWSVEEGVAFLERQRGRITEGSLSLAIDDGSRAVGLVVLMARPQTGVVSFGYWLVPSARGRGLGTRAARLLSGWAVESGGCQRVEAHTHLDNVVSQKALLSAGFHAEGRLRNYLSRDDRPVDALGFSRIPGD